MFFSWRWKGSKKDDPTAQAYLKPFLGLNVLNFPLAKTSHKAKFEVKGKALQSY